MAVKTKPKTKTQKTSQVLVKKTRNVPIDTETLFILDLGSGDNKITPESVIQNAVAPQGSKVKVIGVDLYSDTADVKHDLSKAPFPFDDESVDGAFSAHFIEHLTGPERITFFNEMYRILKPGARMRLIHPYYKSCRAVQDPTHKWPPIAEESYLYWDKNWRDTNKLGHYLGTCDFQLVPRGDGKEAKIFYTWQDAAWANKNEETRNFAIRHYYNIVADMIVDLIK